MKRDWPRKIPGKTPKSNEIILETMFVAEYACNAQLGSNLRNYAC